VQHLLDELSNNTAKMWILGKWLSIEKQTLGFQGWSRIKLHISYKKEGDGFQCDAICNDGYTFSFYICHGDPPPLPTEFKNFDLLPTAQHVFWLALCLPNVWPQIFMDNLVNSRKLFAVLYLAKCLTHGVVQMSSRGIPPSVRQLEEKSEGGHEAEGSYDCYKDVQFCRLPRPLCLVCVQNQASSHDLHCQGEHVLGGEKAEGLVSCSQGDPGNGTPMPQFH
jgi:hypothetical protein